MRNGTDPQGTLDICNIVSLTKEPLIKPIIIIFRNIGNVTLIYVLKHRLLGANFRNTNLIRIYQVNHISHLNGFRFDQIVSINIDLGGCAIRL